MFRKKERDEIEALKRENEQGAREREAARLDLQLSLRKLAIHLGVPVDEGMAAIGGDLAGRRKDR